MNITANEIILMVPVYLLALKNRKMQNEAFKNSLIHLLFFIFFNFRVHMNNNPVKVIYFFFKTTFYCLGDPMSLNYSKAPINDDMGFHLIKASRATNPEVMNIDHAVHTPGAIFYFIDNFGFRRRVGKLT